MSPRGRAAIRAAGAPVLVLLAGSVLPIWTRWHVGLHSDLGLSATLWEAARGFMANVRDVESNAELWALHRGNGLVFLTLLAAAGVAGWRVLRWQRSGAAGWEWFFLAGGLAAGALVLGSAEDVRGHHLLTFLLLVAYVVGLALAGRPRAVPEPGTEPEAIDRLVDLKRRGVLLPRYRLRRRRAAGIAKRRADDEVLPVGELNRLVALKHRIGLSAGTVVGGHAAEPHGAPDRGGTK